MAGTGQRADPTPPAGGIETGQSGDCAARRPPHRPGRPPASLPTMADDPLAGIAFRPITPATLDALKSLNAALLPVAYRDAVYAQALAAGDLTHGAFEGEELVGAVAVRLEAGKRETEGEEGGDGLASLYIMTVGVLAPYRGRGIGERKGGERRGEGWERGRRAVPASRPLSPSLAHRHAPAHQRARPGGGRPQHRGRVPAHAGERGEVGRVWSGGGAAAAAAAAAGRPCHRGRIPAQAGVRGMESGERGERGERVFFSHRPAPLVPSRAPCRPPTATPSRFTPASAFARATPCAATTAGSTRRTRWC